MSPSAPSYLRDPKAIYDLSFERVRAEARLDRFSPDVAEMVIRVIHACGMPDLADDIIASPCVMERTASALGQGAPILCDCTMVASGITRRFLATRNRVVVTLNNEGVAGDASRLGTTRSAAAVEQWHHDIGGAVVAIGNAPTALFHLLEKLADGWPSPAVILGFPVGFVGAAESKDLLAQRGSEADFGFITVSGTRGGSAMASAAVNAGAIMAGRN